MVVPLLMLVRLVVGPGQPHSTIAAALGAAASGDTIEVRSGIYREGPLLLDRPVVLVGRGAPVIEGRGDHTIIRVTASDVIIEGFVLRNVRPSGVEDRAAIRLEGARGCRVARNVVEQSFFGIYAGNTSDCEIVDNRVTGPGGSGLASGNAIHVWSSERVTVARNEVTGHRDGLYLEFVNNSHLADNVSHDNVRYGMHFMFSDSTSYVNNVFRRNGVGVAVMYTRRVTMTGNRFEESLGQAAYGLLLKDINDSRIADNVFARNTIGLYLEGSNRQEVTGNRFTANGWAVRVLANATDNLFAGNVFVGNAFDVTTNSRSATSRFRANYWDHYRGYDLDRDGRGDVPFRPVRLFSLVVERDPAALMLLRSIFVELLDQAERLLPILTPESLVDSEPLMAIPR
jgi:nitrous oxidase accessory protein